jgi:hypothetical protein
MLIKDIFQKDIFRGINGVVKADQTDDASVWQELDEFVITRELDRHLRDFFGWYTNAWEKIKNPDPSAKMGVWINGFFGSGKSHLLKVLSYLLRNRSHSYEGKEQKAVEFFESKIKDPLLFGEIKRAVAAETNVVLFNIDSKADHRTGRDLILRVFLKVLNELQGFSGDHPHIAHMERYAQSKGKLEVFKDAFKKHTASDWEKERDAYEFNRDEVVKAFMEALGQSQSAAEKWIDGAEANFAVTIENFCKWTKEYLDSKGPTHRLIFLVDEVGQFIGSESKLMLNLQSIVEGLGLSCMGRAWVVVTSQEDMDAILGEMKKNKKEDFSKIQGRFRAPLSLSSANVDEVIQARLLTKVPEVQNELKAIYKAKGDILKNQLSFKDCKLSFKQLRDDEDFVKNYPFVPYQFQLVQKIFEAIRKAGATGLHLARGERSMLDAFQSAAKIASAKELGVLVPLYDFYPAIQSFLDTSVKKTIDHAVDDRTLKPFDAQLLQVLFLIRYINDFKGNVDNLVTLCLDQIDCDRLALRRKIEESLGRLENISLISRNGDLYSFLTNEERDIAKEIGQVDLASGEDSRQLGEIVFTEIYKDQRKHRYSVNKMDFEFNRRIDGFPHGQQKDGLLTLNILSPFSDDYEVMDRGRCVLKSGDNGGEVWIRLSNDANLGKELQTYLKATKYLTRKTDGTLPESTKRILAEIAAENQGRYGRLVLAVEAMLGSTDYCVAGQGLKIKTGNPLEALSEAFEYLIQNTFIKMGYLKRLLPEPIKELHAVLKANDISKETLQLQAGESNPDALADLRNQLDLSAQKSVPVVLHDLLERRSLRPYGWVEGEVLVLLGRLLILGEIQLVMDNAVIPLDKAYEALTNTSKRRKILIKKRIVTNPKLIQDARKLGNDLFKEMGPDGEDAISTFLRSKFLEWQSDLNSYQPLAQTGTYPGKQEIKDGLILLGTLLVDQESGKFIERVLAVRKDLEDLADNHQNLFDFYTHTKPTWEKLRSQYEVFKPNKSDLEKDVTAGPALRRMEEILRAPAPYGMLKDAETLIGKVSGVNNTLLQAVRAEAQNEIEAKVASLSDDLKKAGAPDSFANGLKKPLADLLSQVGKDGSLAHIAQAKANCTDLFDEAIRKLEDWVHQEGEKPKGTTDKPNPSPIVKKQRVIKAGELVGSPYLETQEQVDAFIQTLKAELEKAIASNERVQVR